MWKSRRQGDEVNHRAESLNMSHQRENRVWWWWIRRMTMVYLLDRQCLAMASHVVQNVSFLAKPLFLQKHPQNVKSLWEKMREEGKGLEWWWLIMRNMTGWLKNSRSSHNDIAQMLSLLSTQYFLHLGLPGFLRLTQISLIECITLRQLHIQPPFPILICSLITIWMC